MARRFVRSLAPRLRLYRSLAGLGAVVAWLSSCTPSSGGVNVATGGTAGQTGATGGGGAGGSGATPVLTGGSAPIITGGSGNTPGTGGSGAVTACATENTEAQPAPLDIYVMLDSSLSMVDLTPSGVSKWDAVRSAISAFLQDPSSAGISVGIQYFPLRKPDVPARCTSNADCGSGGSCLLKWCSKYGNFVAGGIAQCDDDTDCTEIPALTNYGPCTNGSCAMDSVRTCTGDSECMVEAMANFGPCATFGHCEIATDVACPAIGMDCGPDEQGVERGVCVAATDSYCFHGTQCDTAGYAAPAVEIGLLPDAAATLVASLDARVPDGDTPSGPALRGAIAHAREWAVAHPGHTVVAVLATDGLPTECLPDDVRFTRTTSQARLVDDVIAVAAEGAQGGPSISTFVIGVFADSDQEAPENLRRIAEAGGTTQAQLVDTSQDVSAQFIAALNAVRASRVQCELQIPEPHGGATPNYFEVNVAFTEGGTTTTLYYVGSPDRCDPVEGGWYYDDFAGIAPNRILVCPQNCNVFQASATGSVEIQLGCETILR